MNELLPYISNYNLKESFFPQELLLGMAKEESLFLYILTGTSS